MYHIAFDTAQGCLLFLENGEDLTKFVTYENEKLAIDRIVMFLFKQADEAKIAKNASELTSGICKILLDLRPFVLEIDSSITSVREILTTLVAGDDLHIGDVYAPDYPQISIPTVIANLVECKRRQTQLVSLEHFFQLATELALEKSNVMQEVNNL